MRTILGTRTMVVLVFLACLVVARPLAAARPDMAALVETLRDKTIDAGRRRAAALTLLEQHGEPAVQVLVGELAPSGDPAVQQAVVQAVATAPARPPAAVADVLIDVLARGDPAMADDLAAALGRYVDDPKFTKRVVDLALSNDAATPTRRGAVAALGAVRSQAVARVLIRLIQADQPQPVRDAAFASLARLSAIADFNTDQARWEAWWAEHRDDPLELWQDHLLANFARGYADQSGQRQRLLDRLIESQRQLYRALPQDDRRAMLVTLAGDPLDATRQLALELIRQRIEERPDPLNPEVRAALLARLDDPAPTIRRSAALLLRDLGDEEAADTVARRLAAETPEPPAVMRAYLQLLVRLPRAEAIDRQLVLLTDPALQLEAASALSAAAEVGLLDAEKSGRAAALARGMIRDDLAPPAEIIDLVGRVGNDEDWQRISGWIDGSDAPAKEAVARAWARSDRSLVELARRASDPVVQPIAISAVLRRGHRTETLLALIANPPAQADALRNWGLALVAMAGRVPSEDVVKADVKLAEIDAALDLREGLLTTAISRLIAEQTAEPTGTEPAVKTTDEPTVAPGGAESETIPIAPPNPDALPDLLLARAAVRLALLNPQQAQADLQMLADADRELSREQQARLDELLEQAHKLAAPAEPPADEPQPEPAAPAAEPPADTTADTTADADAATTPVVGIPAP